MNDPDPTNNAASAQINVSDTFSRGGGGGCTFDPNARFDPVIPALLVLWLLALARRRRHPSV